MSKYPEALRTVGIVTARAILLPYGAVMVLVLSEPGLHVHDALAILFLVGPVMTAQAEVHGLLPQVCRYVGHMRVMTVEAGTVDFKSPMLYRVLAYLLFLLLVTAQTEARS